MYHADRFCQRRPARCTIGVILVQTVCQPSRRWQRRSSFLLASLEEEHVLDDAPVVPA